MTKKRSIFLIIFLSIILIIGLLASFVSFTYPLSIGGNYYKYSSFVNELVMGSDVSEGVVVTYKAETPEGDEASYDDYMHNTILGLEQILQDAGYKDSTVSKLGEDRIQVIIGDLIDYEEQQEAISLIGSPQKLKFSSNSSATADDALDISAKFVKDAKVKQMEGSSLYYIEISMTSEGKSKLDALADNIVENSGKLYVYLGETAFLTLEASDVPNLISDGKIMLPYESFVNKEETMKIANVIKTGLLDMKLTQIEATPITASLGNRISMFIAIAFAVVILLSFIFLAVKYYQLGGMAIFNMLYFIVIGLGLLQSIPFIHLNMSGILGMALCYAIAFGSIVSICENARKEFATGKKLHTCFKLAQKKSLTPILVSNIFLFLASVVCALVPNASISSFGGVALVLSLTNLFCSLVWFRVMLKLYSGLNFYKGERCNFKREEAKNNAK